MQREAQNETQQLDDATKADPFPLAHSSQKNIPFIQKTLLRNAMTVASPCLRAFLK